MQAKSIDEVLQNLAQIIQSSRQNRKRAGYFAALYYRLTVRIRDEIAVGGFDDGERVRRLAIALANRYFEAYVLFQQGGRPARCWEMAFRANRDTWLVVLQHLLLALNAHINLDLAVATATTCPASKLRAFRADFDRINQILSKLVDDVIQELSQIWPVFGALSPLVRGADGSMVRFSLPRAREHAWDLACELAGLTAAAQSPILDRHDQQILEVAETIRNPGLLNLPLMTVRLIERGGVAETIELLQ